jgi:two-component system, LytTR family, response regulator
MSRLLRCVLIDDELLALSYLRTLCGEIPGIEVVRAFDDPEKLIGELPGLDVDFCISDIVMPKMNGLELAEKLKGMPVIFTTAHNEFAADAFDIDAVDYLRKPVKKERLLQAIAKIETVVLPKNRRQVQLSTAKGRMMLSPDEIAFISADTPDRRDKLVTLKTGEELVIKNYSFAQLSALLPAGSFIRISRRELLSLSIVKGYSSGTVLSGFRDRTGAQRTFNLGDNYKKQFLEAFGG